jgi:hypothetical protein
VFLYCAIEGPVWNCLNLTVRYEFDWINSEINTTIFRDANPPPFYEFDKIKFLEVMSGVFGWKYSQ